MRLCFHFAQNNIFKYQIETFSLTYLAPFPRIYPTYRISNVLGKLNLKSPRGLVRDITVNAGEFQLKYNLIQGSDNITRD